MANQHCINISNHNPTFINDILEVVIASIIDAAYDLCCSLLKDIMFLHFDEEIGITNNIYEFLGNKSIFR